MDRNELRRLQKAARDNNKFKLAEWATQFENQVRAELEKRFEDYYQKQVSDTIDNFILAILYTLHFSENTKLGKKRLPDFMEDLFVSVDMFRTGEYNPNDYKEELEKCGIFLSDYTYEKRRKDKEVKNDEKTE